MAYFKVMLHGEGVEVPDVGGGPPIVGFYTTRLVRAVSPEEAKKKAAALVVADWSSGEYATSNRAGVPRLTVESVHPTGWLQSLTFRNKGHTFYAADDNDAQQGAPGGAPKVARP